jgi:uncharacterized protein (TIGR02757 family)
LKLESEAFKKLRYLLNEKTAKYNRADFIEEDPISIPHRFSQKQDIEISGFISAILAWGQRKTIISKSAQFLEYMDNTPFEFVVNHSERDLKPFLHFKHRTFNDIDALYFIHFLQKVYSEFSSLEDVILKGMGDNDKTVESGLNFLKEYFIKDESYPARTGKHVSSPKSKSACKRINMFLRWMVRKDSQGVDFGIWENIKANQLVCPCDVHVEKVARRFGLIKRKPLDWKTALELTATLRMFDPSDPVKYDFALFGMGVFEK